MAEECYYYESRFVCKLCNRAFPCGKSLGGHMRSHVVANSPESDELFEEKISSFVHFEHQSNPKDSKAAELGNGPQSSYVLRENPRKTWRAADTSRLPLPQDKICKQCGKGFQSMKALCGHMACHSERDKASKDDSSWTSENQKAILDSCSDTEEGEERRIRTRSFAKSRRFKNFVEKSHFLALADDDHHNHVNGCSSVSDIDGQNHEEVAMCLMMLSRDLWNNYSVAESSDNNSVVLETKSSSIEKSDHIEKLKGKLLNDENAHIEDFDSDSEYFLDECATKVEPGLSVDMFWSKNYGIEVGKNLKGITKELQKSSNGDKPCKKSKYECYNCKKTFKSYQALGGHRPCHKRTNAFYEPRYESGENSADESADNTKKKAGAKKSKYNNNNNKGGKEHVCPFCDKVFKNGQALGGHKRSHFITSHAEMASVQSRAAKAGALDLLDLNLPAPEDD